MNLDRDLRDALRPLAGDPTADAQRVLAALPDVAPVPDTGPQGLPKWFWWANGGALAAGLALGFLLGYGTLDGPAGRGGGVGPATGPPTSEQAKKEQAKKSDPMWPEDAHLVVMPFGQVTVDEPSHPRQDIEGQQYMVELGAALETYDSTAGVYVYGNDVRVRLASASVATVDRDLIALREGTVWLSTVARPTAVRIEAGFAVVSVEAAELLVERRPTGMEVTVLAGDAEVHPTAGAAQNLTARQRLAVDAAGASAEPVAVPFLGTITAWMVPMILQQQDPAELQQRVGDMVAAYAEGTHRAASVTELRRLGSHVVPALYRVFERAGENAALARETAGLIGDVANYQQAGWLLAVLERGDEDVRATAFQALRRITGLVVEDETFWRVARAEDRAAAVLRWHELLR